jgi:hypothetical protein
LGLEICHLATLPSVPAETGSSNRLRPQLSKIVENEDGRPAGDVVEANTLDTVAENEKPKLQRQGTMYETAEIVTFVNRFVTGGGIWAFSFFVFFYNVYFGQCLYLSM